VHDEVGRAAPVPCDGSRYGSTAEIGGPPPVAGLGDEDRRRDAAVDLNWIETASRIDQQRVRVRLSGRGPEGVEADPEDPERLAERRPADLVGRAESKRHIVVSVDHLLERRQALLRGSDAALCRFRRTFVF